MPLFVSGSLDSLLPTPSLDALNSILYVKIIICWVFAEFDFLTFFFWGGGLKKKIKAVAEDAAAWFKGR